MKSLSPSLKEKKRYIAFEVLSKKKVSYEEVFEAVTSSVKQMFGNFGLAKAGIVPLPEKYRENKGLIRVGNKGVDMVKSAMIFIKKIKSQSVMVRTLGISGVLIKAQKRYIEVK